MMPKVQEGTTSHQSTPNAERSTPSHQKHIKQRRTYSKENHRREASSEKRTRTPKDTRWSDSTFLAVRVLMAKPYPSECGLVHSQPGRHRAILYMGSLALDLHSSFPEIYGTGLGR
jgi:hypothetical protein